MRKIKCDKGCSFTFSVDDVALTKAQLNCRVTIQLMQYISGQALCIFNGFKTITSTFCCKTQADSNLI